MPLARKIQHRSPDGTDCHLNGDAGRGRSGSPDARGPRFEVRLFAIIFTILGLITFLVPGTIPAARIAGDEQPVTATPAASPAAGAPSRVQTNPVSNAGTSTVSAPSPAPVSSQAGSPPLSVAGPQQKTAVMQPQSSPAVQTVKKAAGHRPQTPKQAPASPPAVPSQVGRYVTIDFDNVDISVFIKFVSELTGRNFVIDDKVKGKVTVISPKKIAVDEVYKVFESVLDIYGFATVEAGDVIKVIPALEARGKNMELRLKRESIAPEDKIVTQILTLQHATADDMKKVLDPLISKTSVILAYPPAGMLIITDVLSNIKRLQDIVTALDVEGVGELISYIPLKYASATEMAKSLALIFQKQAVPGRAGISQVKVVADDRTNALIILAAENDMTRIRELLNLMDKEVPKGTGMIRVYYLQNAKAEDLAKILTSIPQQAKTATGTTTTAPSTSTAAFSKNVQIMADKATNSLIVIADPADYLIIEDVIRKLDITRAMVYLEALIMEVKADKSFNVGVEWSMLKDVNIQSVTDLGGQSAGMVGFTGAGLIPQVNSTGAISMPSGFSMGVVGAGITIGGVLFPNIGAVLNAYQNDTDVRILSTPQLLTLDNEEAEITVGENIPYLARQDTGVGGSTTNYTVGSSYDYKDVGVTLKVTPQINKDGFVRMKIDQSVKKVVTQSATVSTDTQVLTPTTLTRTAKTTVVVKSGETVVIGGMIQDDSSKGTGKVPLLGDIPLLGWLFKTRSTTNTRTNLFVFITPRIIQTPEDASKIQVEKMDYMKTIQEGTIKDTPARRKETKEKELEKELKIE